MSYYGLPDIRHILGSASHNHVRVMTIIDMRLV
jgi:hypothetical protein